MRQPTQSSPAGPRTQPRDGLGRFLPRTWLDRAETFTAVDLAWFRKPLTA